MRIYCESTSFLFSLTYTNTQTTSICFKTLGYKIQLTYTYKIIVIFIFSRCVLTVLKMCLFSIGVQWSYNSLSLPTWMTAKRTLPDPKVNTGPNTTEDFIFSLSTAGFFTHVCMNCSMSVWLQYFLILISLQVWVNIPCEK